MRNRWLSGLVIATFLAMTSVSLAQITVDNTNTSNETNKTWMISELNSLPTADNAAISGTLSGIGGFDAGDSISITADGLVGWWTADAQAAVAGGGNAFTTYLSALTNVNVKGYQTDIGVNSSGVTSDAGADRMGGTLSPNDEVMVFSVDLSNLSVTNKITLTGMNFSIQPGDEFDFIVYDASSNSVAYSRWDNAEPWSGNWVLEHGDLFLIGVGQSMADNHNFRINNFQIDAFAEINGVIPPVGLTASGSNSVVALDWLEDPSPSLVSEYAVYRALTTNASDLVQIATTLNSFYVDTGVTNDVTYYYRATTIDTGFSESEFSDLVFATPSIPIPTGLEAVAGNTNVVLTWEASSDALFAGFTIYRATAQGTNYTAIASNLVENTYTDTTVFNEVVYYYAVTHNDLNGGESGLSTKVSALPTLALIIVNTTDNQQGDTRSYPTGTNEFYTAFGQNHSFGNMKAGTYLFQSLSRPVLKFGFDRSSLGEKTTSDIKKITLRLHMYDNDLRTNNLPGTSVEVYSSQTKEANSEVLNSDFENSTFSLIDTIKGVTNGAPDNAWYEIDVTAAVMADLTLDPQDATAGSVFRVQVNDDLMLTTNDTYAIRIQDNNDSHSGWDFIPQLRIDFKSDLPLYEQWATKWGDVIGANTNDFDHDGLNNLYEYGFNGDPTDHTQASATLPVLTKVGDGFEYITPLRWEDTNLVYTVQTRVNLANGSWTNTGYSVSGTNTTGDTLNFVTNSVNTIDNQKFIRLLIDYLP